MFEHFDTIKEALKVDWAVETGDCIETCTLLDNVCARDSSVLSSEARKCDCEIFLYAKYVH
jgi:hypothetical protein